MQREESPWLERQHKLLLDLTAHNKLSLLSITSPTKCPGIDHTLNFSWFSNLITDKTNEEQEFDISQ